MRLPLHGGHAHAESTGPVAGPEPILVFALGIFVLVVGLQYLGQRYSRD